MSARRLDHVRLRVGAPGRSLAFYRERLGMRLVSTRASVNDATIYRLAFPGGEGVQAALELVHEPGQAAEAWAPGRDDVYWKIGVALADVGRARDHLIKAGVVVSEPAQFLDIGYLCHLRDPDGYGIELLQHDFAQHFQPSPALDGHPLGGAATLGQITLRARDAAASLAFYRDRLGMRLLSIQPVPKYGFTLYFLAFTDERPPLAELEAVGNREWLWRRPYTTLELQVRDAGRSLQAVPGLRGIGVAGAEGGALRDPDGVVVRREGL